jgi:hypothetical protein
MDLQVVNGAIVQPRTQGGGSDFNGAGVPARFPYGLPVTPEEAVGAMYRLTSLRTRTLPTAFNQLDDRGFGQLALCASWHFSLEAPVTVRSEKTGVVTARQDFFVRRVPACYSDSLGVYVASSNQPTVWPLFIFKDTLTNNSSGSMDTVMVMLSGPVLFERVLIVK